MAADLTFRVAAELSDIKKALTGLRQDFRSVGLAAQQAGGRQPFQGIDTGARTALGTVGRLTAGFLTLAGVLQTIAAADELNTLNARLRLVTGSTGDFANAQIQLFELAQRTRTSLGETIGLYTQIANATKDANVGQETLLGVVETINQAVQLSGSSAQAAQAALVQLGQGLASGTLRGEELNSILEQTPALADAIAKGLGITRGELRQFGQDGKLSAEQVIAALQKQRAAVDAQFSSLPLTVGQATTQLRNAGLALVGAFDEASGATGGLASAIGGLAEFLSSNEVRGSVIEFANLWKHSLEAIVADLLTTRGEFEAEFDLIRDVAVGFVQTVVRAFKEFPVNVRAAARIAGATLAGMVDSFIADATLLKEAFAAIFTDDTIEAAIQRRNLRVQASLQAVKDQIDDILADRDRALDQAKAAATAAQRSRDKARDFPGSTSKGTFVSKPTAEQQRAAEQERKALLEEEERTLKDSTQRALGILANLYEDAAVSAADYFRSREAIELASLERSIAIERERAKAGGAEAVKARAEIERLEAAKGDVQRKTLRERAADERKVEQELAQARAQQLESEGRTAEAARIRLEAQFRDLLAKMQAEGNTAGVKLIRGLIDTGVAKARFDELKAQFDKVVADLQARQQAIAAQRDTGAIAPETARQQQAEAQRAAIEQLRALNAQLQALAADPAALPAVREAADAANAAFQRLQIDGLTGLDRAIVELRAQLANLQDSFAQATVNAGIDALTTFFTDLASGAKGAGEALRDFVRNFALSMAQIAARALATFLVLQALDAVYPGLGKATAIGFSGSGNVQHAGGMAGTGPKRQVHPWVFAAAPRYHNGGMVGLKPDEVPAILQRGEEVLAKSDPRNAANAGAGGTRIVNVIDPDLVQDYMSSAAGERVILNIIERNRGAVRQKLA